jgi:hypothetical protein
VQYHDRGSDEFDIILRRRMPRWSIGLLHFKELFNSYFVYSITCNGESIETIKVENAGKLRNCGSLYVEVSKLRMHEVGK